ncbi:MAG: M20/M25/M40 family metallo-hydrolase [Oscillospiraceae bacterium]|nr:M20/M25/M40 family metallo-hydrolase [Oscillospiraceae bacterium]
MINNEISRYIDEHKDEAFDLLVELAQIPAPSHHEEKRAEFCKNWLIKQGAKGVYIDEALNVIYPVGSAENNPIAVFMAHSDVVFPDETPLPLKIEDDRIHCPGVGDDTANVVALLMAAKYIAVNNLSLKDTGLLLVVNSCEEGLGNLKGSRKIIEDFGSRITEFVSFDGSYRGIVSRAVGSKRYKIEIDTEGGHSYSAFGNRNAIAYMSSLIDTLYKVKVPDLGKTTYNVGTISGGTSVNTIAQHAEMLYEFRSDEAEALLIMEKSFTDIIENYRSKGLDVTVTLVGDRPCASNIDPEKHKILMERTKNAVKLHYDFDAGFHSGSTDCNIPLSVGIPAVCVGCVDGHGAHTREEYVEISSLRPGLGLAFDLVLHHFKEN